jgi:tripartite-type tricarboxylate transporter receptor subunit TctC
MKALPVTFALAVASACGPAAIAQTYPAKPITIVVPFAAGGPTDTLARLLGERMRKTLGQPIIVDNTTGAGGSIATAKVVRAPPDGYMVSIGHWGSHVVNGAYYALPFHLLTDFTPVAMIATNPQLVVSKNAVPAKNLKELIAWIRVNQDKMLVGSGGVAASSHMGAVYFAHLIGAKFQYVHYRGGAPALQALLGGEVDLYITQVSTVTGQIKAGKIRAYAVTAKTRQAAVPEVPTVDEAGLPGFHTAIWHGLWLPKGTPRDIVMKLNGAVVEALADPTLRERFDSLGQDIPPRDQQTPEALFAYHKEEIDKWWPMIKAAGLKAE